MTDVMSYQYPPPPHNGADMEVPPSGYLPNYSVTAASGMDPDPSIPSRDRSDSLRRSISTPVVGPSQSQAQAPQPPTPQHSAAPGQDPSAERRRNKLGYHRTSVACGHCRRRKIRCVPSQNDVQGRCINCIRLKKECSFYPVDQQPPVDTRQKPGSRASVGSKLSSASSSPPIQAGIPSDVHGQQPYPQLAMPSIQSMAPPMKPSGSDSYPSEAKISPTASSTRAYDYGQHGMTNWMSADASPSVSKPGEMSAAWRSYAGDSPVTPAFSPYTPHAPSATWSASIGSEPSSRDDIAWSTYPAPPARSLSFGADSMASHQQYQSMAHVSGQSDRAYDRKSSTVSADMYASPVATTIPGIETVSGTALDHSASMSAGAVPTVNYSAWQQPYSYSKPNDPYGGWYGETGTHQQLGSGDQHASGHGQSSSNVYYGR